MALGKKKKKSNHQPNFNCIFHWRFTKMICLISEGNRYLPFVAQQGMFPI